MDVLVQKPKGSVKAWTIAGIIAVIVFYVCYVFIDLYYSQAYQGQLGTFDFIGLFIGYNGIFTASVLVFLIGLFTAKKKEYFLKFMLWTMMLTGFFVAMPGITNLFQYFMTYSGIALMYYIGLSLPQILICVLLVSAILQKDSVNKSITNMIAWIGIVVNVLLIIFQLVYLFGSQQSMDSPLTAIAALISTVAMVAIICLDFVFLNATKASVTAGNGKLKEETLDNLVEKIAKEPKQEEVNLEDMVEKISHEDD
jgi:hypothetical protein